MPKNLIEWNAGASANQRANRQWAFATKRSRAIKTFDPSGRIVVNDGPLDIFMEHALVQDGVSLFVGGGRSPKGYSVSPTGEMPSRNLVIGCLLGGAGSIVAEGNETQDWRLPGQMYAVSLSERQLRYDIGAQSDYRSVAVMLTPDALELMASEDGVPDLVTRVLEGKAEPISLMRAMSGGALRAAQELMTPVYQGQMGALYRKAKSLELIAHQMEVLAEEPVVPGELSPRELVRVREARERLLADLANPPDLVALGRSVGLTPKRLNLGFRYLFGTTVFSYLLEARLIAARQMLEQGLDIPLKQLAWMMGYRQSSNFITAFRRRFGVSPGIYRRDLEDS